MTVIPSPYLAGLPKLASTWQRAGAPPRPAAAADAPHPALAEAASRAEPPGARDRVADAEPAPAFSYRTDDALLRRLPPAAAALLRRFDDGATEARDRTVALANHINAAADRLAVRRTDLAANLRAARPAGIETVDDARAVLATPPDSRTWGPTERGHAAAIVAAADRVAEAEGEVARLRDRLREHNERTAPITALRNRLAEAAARLRPPVRATELPTIDPKRAEKTLAEACDALAEACDAIAEARAEIARIEGAKPHPDDLAVLAREAAARYGAEAGGLRAAVRWDGGAIRITEAVPGLATEDRRPLRPLALLCAIDPDMVAAAIARAIGADPDAPRLADRPRLIAEARARLRDAELRERAAIRAMDDPLEAFRPDADPLVTLAVEAGR